MIDTFRAMSVSSVDIRGNLRRSWSIFIFILSAMRECESAMSTESAIKLMQAI